ncbi:Uu.00g102830.m01.CDS01 [Anthostomella pinea]|uniref:Uu.00g102830.m01.CDS01 n=1 Tax=Anthostomella pinea TaxID=933095 RepID=A0AAI8VDI7_9PEZI|nr:Uu.00g102830.m01.CDS01 [Anthostomella pinea]
MTSRLRPDHLQTPHLGASGRGPERHISHFTREDKPDVRPYSPPITRHAYQPAAPPYGHRYRDEPSRDRNTVRHRLMDADERETRPPTIKQNRAYYSVAPLFDKYPRRSSMNEDDTSIDRYHNRPYQRKPDPEPENPMVTDLVAKYQNIRTTLHSNALKQLEEAQEKMASLNKQNIKTRLEDVAARAAKSSELHSSLLTATEDAQAEIEELGRAILSDGNRRLLDGDFANLTRGMSPSHENALIEFGADIEGESKLVVDEMIEYEKNFLEEIDDEVSNIVKSLLQQ